MSKELSELQEKAFHALYKVNEHIILNHRDNHGLIDETMRWLVQITDKLNDMVEMVERVERTPVALYCHVCDRNRPVVMRIAEGGYYIQDVYKDKDGNLTNEKPNPTVIGPFSYHCKCCGAQLADSTYALEQELSIPGAKDVVVELGDSIDDMPWEVRNYDEIKKRMARIRPQ